MNDAANENNDNDLILNKENSTTGKSCEYKTKIIGSTEVVAPLKCLSNFLEISWFTFD